MIERLNNAPLPVTDRSAAWTALKLRRLGLSYGAISTVMTHYHGQAATDVQWRYRCTQLGAEKNLAKARIAKDTGLGTRVGCNRKAAA